MTLLRDLVVVIAVALALAASVAWRHPGALGASGASRDSVVAAAPAGLSRD